MKRLVVLREARREFDKASLRYQSIQEGLGLDFYVEVRRVFMKILDHPALASPFKSTRFRFWKVRRFPYLVYFKEFPDEIVVWAIAHARRRPGYFRRRRRS